MHGSRSSLLARRGLSFVVALVLILFAMIPVAQARGQEWPMERTRALPNAANLVSPSGAIGTDYNPTYTWTKVSDATWYYLWVGRPSGNVFKQWYDAALVCGVSTCSATPARTLAGGSYTWYIQTWNSAGYGPWSAGMPFSLTTLGAAVPVSPAGAITEDTLAYTWTEVPGAAYYYLFVNGPAGNVLKKWYTRAEAACSAGTCSVTPTSGLGGGDHTWWVRTWNGGGYGPWSTGLGFSLPVPRIPSAATLIAPSGSISYTTPEYSWNEVTSGADSDAATWYYLWVNDPTGNVIKQWYESSAVCSTGTCSVTPSIAVIPGASTWWVQTWNSAGFGPWSTGISFSIPIPWPLQPVPISPSGSSTNSRPTYSWNAASSETGDPATWYQLSVNRSGNNVISQWYTAAEAGCSADTGSCSITPSTSLAPANNYSWQVRGYNAAGSGPWSSPMFFHIASNCSPAYPTVCIPPPPPDLDCGNIPHRNFLVLPPDPHNFDGDHDGIGCET